MKEDFRACSRKDIKANFDILNSRCMSGMRHESVMFFPKKSKIYGLLHSCLNKYLKNIHKGLYNDICNLVV